MRRALALAAALAASLAGCARPAATTAPGSGPVGYVRMDALVRVHPLYPELARYDRSIDAFDLTAAAPQVVAGDPQVKARERALQAQLDAAAARTRRLIDQKQHEYEAQENRAIGAALAAAGDGGPGAAAIAGAAGTTARAQAAGAAAQAQQDLAAYAKTLDEQSNAQIAAAQQTLAARAERTYRSAADRLQAQEAALSLQLANEDAPQRLAVRTKLSSLALDDAQRTSAEQQLAGLDRKESDAVAAQRNRDQQSLAALQARLRDGVRTQLAAQAAKIRARGMTLMAQRRGALVKQLAARGAVPLPGPSGVPAPARSLPPALRSKIQQLHQDYEKRFQTDAKATIAQFQQTRADLSRRYAQLEGAGDAAGGAAQAQVAALRKKREDLYQQITAQIDRQVRVLAKQRGISVVFTDIVAPAGSVDLTPDALKDIENLQQ